MKKLQRTVFVMAFAVVACGDPETTGSIWEIGVTADLWISLCALAISLAACGLVARGMLAAARESGVVRTMFGRRRYIPLMRLGSLLDRIPAWGWLVLIVAALVASCGTVLHAAVLTIAEGRPALLFEASSAVSMYSRSL